MIELEFCNWIFFRLGGNVKQMPLLFHVLSFHLNTLRMLGNRIRFILDWWG